MYRKSFWRHGTRRFALLAAMTLGVAMAAPSAGVDDALAGWLGREMTIQSSTLTDQIPVGGKLTFIYDATDSVVRVCTRQVATQIKPWRSDLAVPCGVTLTFTRGTRYCTVDDVKTGNAEILSSCHRLRSREVALQPSTSAGVELNDMIIFLVQGPNGKHQISILVDSPARVTGSGSAIGQEG